MELSLIGSQRQFLSTYPEGKVLAVGPLPGHPDITANIQWQVLVVWSDYVYFPPE